MFGGMCKGIGNFQVRLEQCVEVNREGRGSEGIQTIAVHEALRAQNIVIDLDDDLESFEGLWAYQNTITMPCHFSLERNAPKFGWSVFCFNCMFELTAHTQTQQPG